MKGWQMGGGRMGDLWVVVRQVRGMVWVVGFHLNKSISFPFCVTVLYIRISRLLTPLHSKMLIGFPMHFQFNKTL